MTCVSILIAIGTTNNKLEINVSLITINCLRLFVVVDKDVILQQYCNITGIDRYTYVYQVLSLTLRLTS